MREFDENISQIFCHKTWWLKTTIFYFYRNNKKEDCFHLAPAIFIDNFHNYLFHLLDQYDNQNKLSWHGGNIPEI